MSLCLTEKGINMKAYQIGELLAKISIIAFFAISYCIVSTLDFKLLYGG